jgi:hypothetical protein
MSVAQGGSDFGGDFVERLSDVPRCASGVVGSMNWGIVLSSLMWRYLSAANCSGSGLEPWDGRIDAALNPGQ